jgi:excisionase family DNA binding protein
MTKPRTGPPSLPNELTFLTPAQVCEALQISESAFDTLISTKQLESIKLDHGRRVSRAALLTYISARLAR